MGSLYKSPQAPLLERGGTKDLPSASPFEKGEFEKSRQKFPPFGKGG